MNNIKKIMLFLLILFSVFFIFTNDFHANESNSTSKTHDLETYSPVQDNKGSVTCDDIFGNKNDTGSLMHILNEVYKMGKIIAVIMVIALSMMDFTKAVASNDSGILKKTFDKFVKRLVILMALFLIPGFIKLIFVFVFGEGAMCSF